MQEKTKRKVLSGFQLVLRPIVKILLRYGISFSEFAETAKTAFVDVATSEFGIRGRPTNISRVAVMTGLTRKEVRRLRDKIEDGDDAVEIRTTPIAKILTRWHSEREFLDADGRPVALPFSGTGRSFSELVKKFGGDVPPGAMRTELKRIGSVEEDSEGRLSVVRRSVVPDDETDYLLTSLVHSVYSLLSAVELNSNPEKSSEHFPQFTAHSMSVRREDLPRLRRISYERLSDLAASFDDLFSAYASVSEELDEQPDRAVAVGMFYFEERDKNAKYKW